MTPRERVFCAVRRQEPDRVPFNLRLADDRFQKETSAANNDYESHFGCDLRRVSLSFPRRPAEVPRNEWFAQPTDGAIAACAAEAQRRKAEGWATFSNYICGVYEEAKFWVGDAELLTMPYDDPARLAKMLDRIAEIKMLHYGAYARAGVDIIHMGDDLGAQKALIMSPSQYREWYRPCHQRIVKHLRSINPSVLIAFHCCGHVTPLIGDLIELGIDILEAVQPEAMDLAELKRDFGHDIAFWGGVGNQSVLAPLRPDEVAASVRRTVELMAPGGGYLAAPCHTITDDIPWKNVVAFAGTLRPIEKTGDLPC